MFQPLIRIIAFSCVSAFLFSSEAFALSREELERSVEEVTVRILERRCDSSPSLEDEPICWEEAIGTGTIVAKSFNTYYVLTARHVVDNDTDYTVRTVDQELRPAQPNRIVKLENDLAVIAFSDEKQYSIANLYKGCFSDGSPDRTALPSNQEISLDSIFCRAISSPVNLPLILVTGYPIGDESLKSTIGSFIDRNPISLEAQIPYSRGYEFFYTNETDIGMSGGGVWDANGQMIGVHGQTEKEIFSGVPFGYSVGIPIDFFLHELNNIFSDIGFSIVAQDLQIYATNSSPFAFSQEDIDYFHDETLYQCSAPGRDREIIELTSQFYRIGQYEKALECLEKAIIKSPDSSSVLFARGLLLMKMERLSESLAILENIVRKNNSHPDKYVAWRWIGVVLNKMGRYSDALKSFVNAASIYRKKTGEPHSQAWANIFSTLNSLANTHEISSVNWNNYETWNAKGDKLYELSMYGLSLEAYETAQQLGEGEKYATVGRIKSHAALNNQTPLFEILASNPSVSHIDPVWYYSYIFEVFLEMIQENGVNEDLQKDLELRWQSIIEDSGNENAYSSLYLYALEKISEHQSRTTDIITWALGFRPSGSSNDDAGNLSDTDYISTLSGETTSESIKETYKMLRKIVEDLKSRGLYEQAFNFCSFGIVFYYDVNRYNLEVNDENHDIIQDSNSSVQISCSSDYNSIVISPDSSLPYDTEDVSHQPIRIEVDLANQTDEQTTSNSFENVIKDFAEEIIRQNTR